MEERIIRLGDDEIGKFIGEYIERTAKSKCVSKERIVEKAVCMMMMNDSNEKLDNRDTAISLLIGEELSKI